MNTPEEIELKEKRIYLEELSDSLASEELNLEEIKEKVNIFQYRYYNEIGRKYVELDDILAQVAELKARRKPQDTKLGKEAEKARTQAKRAAKEFENIDNTPNEEIKNVSLTEEAKKLYRKIASVIHPDKATDDTSREIRTILMAELNEAYRNRDIKKMQEVLDKWLENPDSVIGTDIAAELVRTIRTIAQVKRRISGIKMDIQTMLISDIYILLIKVRDAERIGRNLLEEMAENIDMQIREARKTKAEIE